MLLPKFNYGFPPCSCNYCISVYLTTNYLQAFTKFNYNFLLAVVIIVYSLMKKLKLSSLSSKKICQDGLSKIKLIAFVEPSAFTIIIDEDVITNI